LATKSIVAMLSTESSDSGALNLSDNDYKHSKSLDQSQYWTSGENALSEHSLYETQSSQDDENFFTSKELLPKCFDVLKDIVMLERTAVSDLKILSEDFYQIFCERIFSCGRTAVDFFGDLKYLYRFHYDHLSALEELIKNWKSGMDNTNTEQPKIGDTLLCSVDGALQHYRVVSAAKWFLLQGGFCCKMVSIAMWGLS
uniref:DH domain-containing protein n=1 Tax=Gongylonema pulchrum TaxID=637853 RepID=A0A183CX58_9BILA